MTRSILTELLLQSAALEKLLGPRFASVAAIPTLVDNALFPEERLYLSKACAKRRADFGTARVCARTMLARLGLPPCPLVPETSRAPQWPAGIKGSISHTDGCCAVTVTDASAVAAIGLDVEQVGSLPEEIEKLVCTRRERKWLDQQPADDRGWLTTLFFSAKEAYYKCQYPLTGHVLDFQEVDLLVNRQESSFSILDISSEGSPYNPISTINGKYTHLAGLLISTAVLMSCDWSSDETLRDRPEPGGARVALAEERTKRGRAG